MVLGFCGAQRTGKTTLARLFAQARGFRFVQTTVRQALAAAGFHAQDQYDIETRITAQEVVLDALLPQWESMVGHNSVCDRTPLCLKAYMEADVLRNFPQDAAVEDRYFAFMQRLDDACTMFDKQVLVQPGIKLVPDPDAGQCSVPYIEHFNNLMLGYSTQYDVAVMPRHVQSIEDRLSFINVISTF